MRKLILPIASLILVACSEQNNQKPIITSQLIEKETKTNISASNDTVTFEQFEKFINNNIELAEPIPNEWVKKFIKDIQVGTYKGRWINSINNFKIAYLEHFDESDCQNNLFITFDSQGQKIDSRTYLAKCRVNGKWKKFHSKVTFFGKPNEFQISYLDNTQDNILHPDMASVLSIEKWTINEKGNFILIQ